MSSTSMTATATSAAETGGNQNQGGNGSPNSPLLFFVALGFGVVFTNLWIIVGVKYCFRYNQRNRARMAGEDPDAVDLAAMPQRRRRREKKLMTIDEVNEKFPLVKYKTWRATRADQGLPTSGGITNETNRPASIRNVLRTSQDDDLNEKIQPASPTTIVLTFEKTGDQKVQVEPVVTETNLNPTQPSASSGSMATNTIAAPPPAVVRTTNAEDVDNVTDQIQTAIPPEQLPDPGDTCAICIDTIEDDDDVRGLSCGHAFHASCVDPWLTSRRACCPLCKADYYVPKPRPEGQQQDTRRNENPPTPFSIIPNGRPGFGGARSRVAFTDVLMGTTTPRSARRSRRDNNGNDQSRPAHTTQSASTPSAQPPEIQQENTSWRQRFHIPNFPALSRIRAGRGNEAGAQPVLPGVATTPAQLEAGTTR